MKTPLTDACTMCAGDLAGADNPCPECRSIQDSPLAGLSSVGPWMGPLREWLSLLKYGGDVRLIPWVTHELIEIWTSRWRGIPVVPVPPRVGKIRREGRCLVSLFANELEKNGLPVLRILHRRDRMAQKDLSKDERLKGERLNFTVKSGAYIGEEVVLLDDIRTTGTTLDRCASKLKDVGVERAFAMVVCRD